MQTITVASSNQESIEQHSWLMVRLGILWDTDMYATDTGYADAFESLLETMRGLPQHVRREQALTAVMQESERALSDRSFADNILNLIHNGPSNFVYTLALRDFASRINTTLF